VRPLAVALRSLGVSVWFDEFSLKLGDSLSRSIDKGIADSRYGVVVISPAFVSKAWPEYELRGLVSREIAQDAMKIIPVWHRVEHQQVLRFSPSLADKVAIKTAGLEALDVALQVLMEVRPDIYQMHPRAELAKIASGEAIAELKEDLENVKDQLAEFQCPFCGAPLVEQTSVPHTYGDDLYQGFDCGHETGGGRETPCPSDPKFPKFEEYELRTEYHAEEGIWPWVCYALPRTHMAQRLGLFRALGKTEREAMQEAFDQYKRKSQPWKP
jgi:hypothetical protein